MHKLSIVHLYPREMNIYGDTGNILALQQRLAWRGYEYNVVEVGVGDEYDFTKADLVFGGGGQDKGQLAVGDDLQKRQRNLVKAVEAGVPMLMVCGMYQLFGHGFQPAEGERIPGIGVFDAETVASKERMVGNVVIDTSFGQLVGFENHSGRTKLGEHQASFGGVRQGYGNDGQSGEEGAQYQNTYGTYLHGPLLPKNPKFTDALLQLALRRKLGSELELMPLDDGLEQQAARVAMQRPQ